METIIIVVLLLIAVETTYLSVSHLRKRQKVDLSPVFIDTSVLIDGRIIPIAASGFLTRPLYIPRSVVGELQFLADNADPEKRTRARHGLDVIKQLQELSSVKTVIFSDSTRAEDGVDNRLLELAKKYKGALCTIDFNLNKVAIVEGIEVLNVNDLAKTLRMSYLPGEKIQLELTQKGNDSHQGVGHLPDGTMVVVEQASKYIGSLVEVEFIRSLQTAAGKMMFAKLVQRTAKKAPQQKQADNGVKKIQKPSGRQPYRRTETQQEKSIKRPAQTRQKQQRRSSKQTPEDMLVELANK